MRRRHTLTFLTLAVLMAVAALVIARRPGGPAIRATLGNGPLAAAVAKAENYLHGKAIRAGLERTASGLVYDVTVLKAGHVFDVRLDARNGRILSAAINK
ncbi:PepSY domain-containing protein [Ralstonia sp. A12]|uniref:PepSY domain-containing protein n=1 Tax=Ralstonia sp. A12 TaxID=1217052 RepID=UPI0012EE4205|nr:PepSY domain-containing protein [Ralstonia sp. A12]